MTGWQKTSRRKAELPRNWPALRRQVIARDRVCVMCGSPGNQVDHIDRLGPHELSNLRLLCEACHMRRTAADGVAVRRERAAKARQEPVKHPGLM